MKIRVKTVVAGVAILFGVIILFNVIKAFMIKRFFANYTPPAVSVSSITAKQQNWEPQINAVGNFNAINGVEVNSQVSGNVVALHFQSGQYIEANQPLIDIDDSIDQAILKANQSELALQEINYKRQTDLLKRGATPGSSVDEARAKLLQAQAEVEKAQASIHHKHITTPFAGQLGIRKVDLGQYIIPGQTEIVTLQSMDPLYLNFYLPEQLFNRLHPGQVVTFRVEKNPNLLFEGKITAINSRIDTKTHNIQVQATLPNCPLKAMQDPSHSPLLTVKKRAHDGKMIVTCNSALNAKNKIESFNFIPGMFAAIDVQQPAIPNQIVLPTTAISYSLYGNSVYIIENDSNSKDQLVVKRVFVSTGDQQGNYTVIKKGVKAGQQVVNSGELKLQDGTPVVINNSVQLKDSINPDELGE
jgi:membrane fusion protein (multidrug efflux system)